MRARWLIVAAAATFVLSLLWRTPAALAYQWLGLGNGQIVQLQEVRGRALAGEAQGVLFGSLPVERVSWHWRPAGLLFGRFTLDTRLDNPGYRLRARVGFGIAGRLAVTDLDGGVPLGLVARQFAGVETPLAATVDPERMDLYWRDGILTGLQGPLYLRALRMQDKAGPQLGDVLISFPGGDPPWRGEIQDQGGPVRVAGELTVSPDGAYTVDLSASAREQEPTISGLLTWLGPPDAQGNYRLTLSGAF